MLQHPSPAPPPPETLHTTSDLLRLLAADAHPFAAVAEAVAARFGGGAESQAWLARTLVTLLRDGLLFTEAEKLNAAYLLRFAATGAAGSREALLYLALPDAGEPPAVRAWAAALAAPPPGNGSSSSASSSPAVSPSWQQQQQHAQQGAASMAAAALLHQRTPRQVLAEAQATPLDGQFGGLPLGHAPYMPPWQGAAAAAPPPASVPAPPGFDSLPGAAITPTVPPWLQRPPPLSPQQQQPLSPQMQPSPLSPHLLSPTSPQHLPPPTSPQHLPPPMSPQHFQQPASPHPLQQPLSPHQQQQQLLPQPMSPRHLPPPLQPLSLDHSGVGAAQQAQFAAQQVQFAAQQAAQRQQQQREQEELSGLRLLLQQAALAPLVPAMQQHLAQGLRGPPGAALTAPLVAVVSGAARTSLDGSGEAAALQPHHMRGLVEQNCMVASQLLLALLGHHPEAAAVYAAAVAELPMSAQSVECLSAVVAGGGQLPGWVLATFLANCMQDTSACLDAGRQSRHVKLLCACVGLVLQHQPHALAESLPELLSFCIQQSRHKQAAELYSQLRDLEASAG